MLVKFYDNKRSTWPSAKPSFHWLGVKAANQQKNAQGTTSSHIKPHF